MNSNVKAIQDKVTDFNRFGMVLLAVSVFMFIGVLIPSEGKEMQQTSVMMIATILFLAASFFSFKKATSYKKQLNELDGEAK
ncbi:putative permease [Bacillus mesophilus]|nr:putative permease [Bacillus mesophilus]